MAGNNPTSPENKRPARAIGIAAAALLSVALFLLLFHRTNAREVLRYLFAANPILIAAALAVSLAENIFFGAFKWRSVMILADAHMPYKEALAIYAGSETADMFLPFRLGTLGSAAAVSRSRGVPLPAAAAAAVYDRLQNLLALVPPAALFLLFSGALPAALAVAAATAACAAAFAVFAALGRRGRHGGALAAKKGGFASLAEFASKFTFKQHARFFILASFYQYAELAVFYLILVATGVKAPFLLAASGCAVTAIAGGMPVTISGFGLRENAVLLFLAGFAPKETLVAAGLLYSAVEYIWPAVAGAPFVPAFLASLRAGEKS